MKKHKKSTSIVFSRANLILDTEKRTIILNGTINHYTAKIFQGALFDMQSENLEPIIVRILSSSGGCTISSLMIYSILRTCFAPTICIVEKYAHSGAIHILQGAEQRIIMENATIQLHLSEVRFGKDQGYDALQVVYLLKYMIKADNVIYKIMSECTGLSREQLKELYEICSTQELDAKTALKQSLVDKIEKFQKTKKKTIKRSKK